jgi:hypothetical protein
MSDFVVGARTGANMFLYLNGGTNASPVWTAICEIGDLNVDMKRAVAVVERRCNAWSKNIPSLLDVIGVTFKMIHGLGVTQYMMIRSLFFSGAACQYAIMNNAITVAYTEGLVLPALVEEFPWDQPLKDVVNHQVKLSTAMMFESLYDEDTEVDPYWMIVGGDAVYGY